ncbi:LacI family DNA-binding transcriptional regulator [Streptomyces cavernicola]|uniref:LacI family DNA-binding transcriptional regulator n=1 Tax=Streptomyces cavernicola TaxID=3043613 RepID=A0ABT6S6P5_9ACTN|nr:LacI family DNA-binding transcriptional regulator [Streptomyces sp. B-S-A6]MDI3403754.1 LacI family DNA-binding transcriptional regulator [Streptomyces sp. B-S-A6]
MATMVDVARCAGVSVATVSHVVNGTRPVRPATRQAVLGAIDELGYTHNTLARSLVTSRTHSIGLAVSATSNPYFTDILRGVESSALEHGYSLLIADPHEDPEHELRAVKLLHERRVDGLLVAPSARPDALLDHVRRARIPTVFLDRLAGDEHDQVCADNTGPVAELVTHLAEAGHRRIALVSGVPGLSTTTERIAGHRIGLDRAGLAYDPALVVGGESSAEGAERATAELLELDRPPTALVTANNTMTIGALRALRSVGLVVPDHMALAGFDDFAWADVFEPRLTVVDQPSREIGATALRLLVDRLAEPRQAPRTVRLPCAFVHRESCGCGRPADGA